MLNRVPRQVEWSAIVPGAPFELTSADGRRSGIMGTAFTLATRYPAYVTPQRAGQLRSADAVTGLIVESSGRRLAYLSSVGSIDEGLMERLSEVDVLLFDGTF